MQIDPNMGDTTWRTIQETDYEQPIDAKYNFIITLTDNSQADISSILSSGQDGVVFKIMNDVYEQLDMFLEMINQMSKIFLIVGIVIGVFAALMLLNFISVSISAKKKDIGILRAVGARGTDVFKIFFAEAFIIAAICFVVAAVGAGIVCTALNTSLVTIINAELLNYGPINIALILAVSFGISLIATFFPVYFAAKKSPVESIRSL
jgi:ABC-type antimicrobial peptide transport system permease subunit